MDVTNMILEDSVEVEGVGKLYFPKVQDLLDKKEKKFNLLNSPYVVSLDIFDLDEETIKEIKVFDMLINLKMNNEDVEIKYFDVLLESLEFYFKERIIYDEYNYCFKIGKKGILNRDNFDDVADIILLLNRLDRMKKEIPPNFKNDKQKDVYQKLMEGRRKKAEKEVVNIPTIINTVVHGGKSFIPYREIREYWTLFQLYNSYRAILDIDSFTINFEQYLAGAESKKLDMTHWGEKIRI